jgi:hypothetical protein
MARAARPLANALLALQREFMTVVQLSQPLMVDLALSVSM